MGRSERFFDNSKEFRPERWLDEIGTKGPAGLTSDDVLRPFSLGPRNCIGKLLALAEAKLVTAKLMWNFDMELDGPHDTWVEDARFYVSSRLILFSAYLYDKA
jgi:cytochrome P450